MDIFNRKLHPKGLIFLLIFQYIHFQVERIFFRNGSPFKYLGVIVLENVSLKFLGDFYMDNEYRKMWGKTITEHHQLQVDEINGLEIVGGSPHAPKSALLICVEPISRIAPVNVDRDLLHVPRKAYLTLEKAYIIDYPGTPERSAILGQGPINCNHSRNNSGISDGADEVAPARQLEYSCCTNGVPYRWCTNNNNKHYPSFNCVFNTFGNSVNYVAIIEALKMSASVLTAILVVGQAWLQTADSSEIGRNNNQRWLNNHGYKSQKRKTTINNKELLKRGNWLPFRVADNDQGRWRQKVAFVGNFRPPNIFTTSHSIHHEDIDKVVTPSEHCVKGSLWRDAQDLPRTIAKYNFQSPCAKTLRFENILSSFKASSTMHFEDGTVLSSPDFSRDFVYC
ncbi:hypothetical protein ACFE04_000826 [Oxalis oulophora]